MSNVTEDNLDNSLLLAAEECPPDLFGDIHKFGTHDDIILRKLVAHGPVLLRGGRGSGKSAYLLEAYRRSLEFDNVFCVYISLRYLPLLKTEGDQYIGHFCELLSHKIREEIQKRGMSYEFGTVRDQTSLQFSLGNLALLSKRRIILLFDDAAHIGREKPLEVFFDLFRTLSTNTSSCKASIYPGVTKFGVRFDVFNDATVLDVSRADASSSGSFFSDVLVARYPRLASQEVFSDRLSPSEFANFVGRSVVGNMRAFVLACARFENQERIGLPELNRCLVALASDYYWPLMEEVAPKLGVYEVLIDPAREAMENIVDLACRPSRASEKPTAALDRVLIHRQIVSKFGKVLEILEYLGFVSRREASRALKSGGRGPVYALNLCNLLDQMPQQRLTQEIMREWNFGTLDAAEIHSSSPTLSQIEIPSVSEEHGLAIMQKPITVLGQSRAYPYGLTQDKVERLTLAGFTTVGALAESTDANLLAIERVGVGTVKRIRDVVNQAIWM